MGDKQRRRRRGVSRTHEQHKTITWLDFAPIAVSLTAPVQHATAYFGFRVPRRNMGRGQKARRIGWEEEKG